MDRSLLFDATADSDSPTPGYMLNEIARSTTANYQANLQLQEFIVSRLTHKSHNVKYKTLMIVKHVCRTGRAEFKMEMTRKVDPIKECLQFRGPPDPLRGDEIYKRVRDAAKEALDAIFDSQMPVTTSAVAAANRIQGMGNDYVPETAGKQPQTGGFINNLVANITSTIRGDGTDAGYAGHPGATGSFAPGGAAAYPGAGAGGYGGPSPPTGPGSNTMNRSNSGMVGLGNPNFKDARDDKTWLQKASEMASSTVYGGPTGTSAPINSSGNGEFTYASNRGPNAVDTMSNSARLRNGLGSNAAALNNGAPWQSTPASTGPMFTGGVVPELPQGPAGMGRVGHAASDGSYERTMVESLCEPGGLKAVPPEAQLQDFLAKAPTLSPELVGNCLLDTLNSDAYQTRIKGLIVIASLAQARECQAHFDWWGDQLEAVRALLADTKAGVRTQSAKTLRALGEEAEVISSRTSRSVSPKPNRGQTAFDAQPAAKGDSALLDILDMGSEPAFPTHLQSVAQSAIIYAAAVPPAAQLVTPPAATMPESVDMFAGLSLSDTTPPLVPMTTSAPVSSGGFDFMSSPAAVPAPAAAPAAPSSGFDFFADLTSTISTTSLSPGFSGAAPSSSAHHSSRNHGNAISSAFVEAPAKPDHRNAFQEFSLSPGAAQSHPSSAAPQPLAAYQQPTMGGGMYQGMRPGVPTSALAPSMLNPTAPRKAIPTADSLAASNSGFSFLGGGDTGAAYSSAPAGNRAPQDSFGFVTDAMRDLNRK